MLRQAIQNAQQRYADEQAYLAGFQRLSAGAFQRGHLRWHQAAQIIHVEHNLPVPPVFDHPSWAGQCRFQQMHNQMRQERIDPQHEFRIALRQAQVAQKQIVFAYCPILRVRFLCRIKRKRQRERPGQLIRFLRLQVVSFGQMVNQGQNVRRKLVADGFSMLMFSVLPKRRGRVTRNLA